MSLHRTGTESQALHVWGMVGRVLAKYLCYLSVRRTVPAGVHAGTGLVVCGVAGWS